MIDPSIVSLLKYLKMLTEIHNKVLQLHPNFHLDHIHRKAHGVNCLGMTVLRCLSAESASHLGCGHFGPSSPPRGAVQPKSSGPKANFADKHSSHDAMTLSFDPSIRIKSNTPCQKKIKKTMTTQKQPDLQIQGLFPLGCRSAWRRADTPLPLAGLRGSSKSIKSKDMKKSM